MFPYSKKLEVFTKHLVGLKSDADPRSRNPISPLLVHSAKEVTFTAKARNQIIPVGISRKKEKPE